MYDSKYYFEVCNYNLHGTFKSGLRKVVCVGPIIVISRCLQLAIVIIYTGKYTTRRLWCLHILSLLAYLIVIIVILLC